MPRANTHCHSETEAAESCGNAENWGLNRGHCISRSQPFHDHVVYSHIQEIGLDGIQSIYDLERRPLGLGYDNLFIAYLAFASNQSSQRIISSNIMKYRKHLTSSLDPL